MVLVHILSQRNFFFSLDKFSKSSNLNIKNLEYQNNISRQRILNNCEKYQKDIGNEKNKKVQRNLRTLEDLFSNLVVATRGLVRLQ